MFRRLPNGRCRILYVNNCDGHNSSSSLKDAFHSANTELSYFPVNTTHLLQPCDSFVIQKNEKLLEETLERFKMGMVQKSMWQDP